MDTYTSHYSVQSETENKNEKKKEISRERDNETISSPSFSSKHGVSFSPPPPSSSSVYEIIIPDHMKAFVSDPLPLHTGRKILSILSTSVILINVQLSVTEIISSIEGLFFNFVLDVI